MAGETVKRSAVCLDVRPFSRTSHVVSWLTETGRLVTLVKGAVRPKSAFLGQYDLNYTCELVYYARAKGELHALRECSPAVTRDALRRSWRKLVLSSYFRRLVAELAPAGPEAGAWYRLLAGELDALAARPLDSPLARLGELIAFELDVLGLAGLGPDFSGFDPAREWMAFSLERGAFAEVGRCVRVSREAAACLARRGGGVTKPEIALDAARVIGVFYMFHLDQAADVRREVLRLISQ